MAVRPPSVLRVLVADDEPTNVILAQAMLEQLGCAVTTAETGGAALQRWRTGTFDLVLLDFMMPDLDGDQVARAIRSDEARDGRAPVAIAICTAYAREDLERSGQHCAFDIYLGKPVARNDLALAGLVGWVARP